MTNSDSFNVWDSALRSLWVNKQSYDLEKQGLDSSASPKTRFKGYPHIVKVNKSFKEWLHIHSEAELWCEEYLENDYVNHWLEGYQVGDDFIVDLTSNKVESCTNFERAFFFGFKTKEDATMFTLRWLGRE